VEGKKIEKKHIQGKYRWKRNTKRQKGRKEMWKGTKKNGEEERSKNTRIGVKKDGKILKTRNKQGRL